VTALKARMGKAYDGVAKEAYAEAERGVKDIVKRK